MAIPDGRAMALFYCHDTFGLGHFRRTVSVASALVRQRSDLSALIVTGSPLAHAFRLPARIDYLKLPSVAKVGAGHYAARPLDLEFAALSALRAEQLAAAARHLRPELVVVDNVPAGLAGELRAALRILRGRSRIVLGLRDIVDEPARVRRSWTLDGSYELLEEVYDRILVYGERDVFDVVAAYAVPPEPARRTRYVGYLARTAQRPLQRVRRRPLVLVTVGGGEDGGPLLRAALAARASAADDPAAWLVVTGPFLPTEERAPLEALARRLPSTRLVDFVDDVPAWMGAADAVVSMAGYNSVCELLASGAPAVLVPRVEPRVEQLIRARALERRGLARVIDPRELTPRLLAEQVTALLDGDRPRGRPVALTGLDGAMAELTPLLRDPALPLAEVGA